MRKSNRAAAAVAVLLGILTLSALVAPAASAAQPVSDPGANVSAVPKHQSAYKINIVAGKIVVTPNVGPNGLTDCSLQVVAFDSPPTIDGLAFTDCSHAMASIQQTVTIYRSRFFGWEKVAGPVSHTDFNTSSSSLDLGYNCAGTGIHNFRVVGDGVVIPFGQPQETASAFDEVDNVNCP